MARRTLYFADQTVTVTGNQKGSIMTVSGTSRTRKTMDDGYNGSTQFSTSVHGLADRNLVAPDARSPAGREKQNGARHFFF